MTVKLKARKNLHLPKLSVGINKDFAVPARSVFFRTGPREPGDESAQIWKFFLYLCMAGKSPVFCRFEMFVSSVLS